MNKLYMGLDIGSVMSKGVIIDGYDNIIASDTVYTEGNPVEAANRLIKNMKKLIDLDEYQVVSVGTTGGARKLIGLMLEAAIIKNEITASVMGTLKIYPNVRTILEIGGQDAKAIFINNGEIEDYMVNTLCGAGVGAFIDNMARRFRVTIDEMGDIALTSKNTVNIMPRCTVLVDSDLINKTWMGYKKEDILAGVSKAVANNFVNNLLKGKKIVGPIAFNGGVSKNKAVVKYLSQILDEKIIVNNNSQLMGALGIAILARDSKKEQVFDFNKEYNIETKILSCKHCNNNCDIVAVYKNNKMVDHWGNKCNFGNETYSK